MAQEEISISPVCWLEFSLILLHDCETKDL